MTPWKIRKNYVFTHLTPLLRNHRFFGVFPILLTQLTVMLWNTAEEKGKCNPSLSIK